MQTAGEAARERQLVEAFVAGDAAAFEALVGQYHDRLVRDARRYVPHDAAEDLVQDLFLWLWRHRARWTVRTTVRNYLHSAVRNRARDLVKRARIESQGLAAYRQVMAERRGASPEDELVTQELARAIERALGCCSARCRAALLLLDDARRYAEVARQLGIQPGTVHTLIPRARRRLRARLREQGWDDVISGGPPLAMVRPMAQTASRDGTRAVPSARASGRPDRTEPPPHPSTPLDLAG